MVAAMTRRTTKGISGAGAVLAALLLSSPAAAAQSTQDLVDRLDAAVRVPSLNPRDIAYGRHAEQRISLYAKRGAERRPLVIWLNGRDRLGSSTRLSLAWLRPFLFENGFALAEVGLRPDGETSAEERVRDIEAAIETLVRKAADHPIDLDRVVLMGGGLNAHFAALLGTDPSRLRNAGLRFEAVRAVIGFGGVGFDIGRRLSANDYESRYYRRFFGEEAAAQTALSAVSHVRPPNAPAFLFYASAGDRDTGEQAAEFAASLAPFAADAEVRTLPLTRRGVAGTYIGAPQHPETARLRAFLQRTLGVAAAAERPQARPPRR
jgi:acetyl esterase/lipase